MNEIVGIFLVKNEDFFIAWSLMNVVSFCDRIIVLDNESTDRTREILNEIKNQHDHVDLIDVKNANDTQKYLSKYFGTETWVLGVDGDEIHDPIGLARLRSRIQSGEFDQFWSVASSYLHVTKVSFRDSLVSGFTSPPAKVGLKLYNFSSIDNWNSRWRKRERLHGKGLVFRDGYSRQHTYRFSHEENWDEADFRCLHLCFLQRSSTDNERMYASKYSSRKNPAESKRFRRLTRKIGQVRSNGIDYRRKRYARGNIATFQLRGFNQPDQFYSVDPACNQVMAYLENTMIKL